MKIYITNKLIILSITKYCLIQIYTLTLTSVLKWTLLLTLGTSLPIISDRQ